MRTLCPPPPPTRPTIMARAGLAQRRPPLRLGWADPEDRVAGRDLEQPGVGRVGVDPVEEDADLELPAPQVSPQDLRLLVVGKLGGSEGPDAPADPQLAAALDAQVANPLGVTARRHQIPAAFVRQQVDRRGPPLAAGPAADGQDPAAPDADSGMSQRGDRAVEEAAQSAARGRGRHDVTRGSVVHRMLLAARPGLPRAVRYEWRSGLFLKISVQHCLPAVKSSAL